MKRIRKVQNAWAISYYNLNSFKHIKLSFFSTCSRGVVRSVGYSSAGGQKLVFYLLRIFTSHFHGKQFTKIFRHRHYIQYLAPKMSGTLAGKKTGNVSANGRWEPAHNAKWPKSFSVTHFWLRAVNTIVQKNVRVSTSVIWLALAHLHICLVFRWGLSHSHLATRLHSPGEEGCRHRDWGLSRSGLS